MSPMTSCKEHIKDYCSNCTFAGVHFIADDRRHWTERLFWLAMVVISWYGTALLMVSAWESFIQNPISFGVETTYIDWDTRIPAVAICEVDNDQRIYDVSDAIWTPNHPPDLEDVLKELAYYRGSLFYSLDHCYKRVHPLCPLTNISYYATLVRSKCEATLENCTYNGNSFNCCEYFQEISTDIGTCFILNSIQTKNPKPYPMVCNRTHNQGVLHFNVKVPSKVYTLGEDEVPSIMTSQTSTLSVKIGHASKRYIRVRNIENDPLLSYTTPEQRACKFNDENEDGVYPYYSYSACTVGCRRKAQVETCQCNDHHMPGTVPEQQCNMSGLACLAEHYNQLNTLRPAWAARPGLSCGCLPSCDEVEITTIRDEATPYRKKRQTSVDIILAYLPTERYKRNVVRSRLDLVVSVGGTTGLFLGASVLSFVELVIYFTVRVVSNKVLSKQNTNEDEKPTATVDAVVYAIPYHRRKQGAYKTSGVLETKQLYDNYSNRFIERILENDK